MVRASYPAGLGSPSREAVHIVPGAHRVQVHIHDLLPTNRDMYQNTPRLGLSEGGIFLGTGYGFYKETLIWY